jgi:prepilin-type N-terminal cleavage/methylation domain-containing protein
MRHRPGVTLVEVLVAIFIMAIAMLALLALFPLGALSMAQALKDDRCATCAVNAESIAVAQDIRHDLLVAGNGTATLTDSFANPYPAAAAISTTLSQATGYTGPSNGVLVDPFTYPLDTNATPMQNLGAVAGTSLGLPRRSLAFSVNYPSGRPPANNTGALKPTEVARWCSMLDGITWVRGDNVGANAVPDTSGTGGSFIVRDGRYTWAWLLRRPLWSSDSVIDMSVIVFSGRPALTPPPHGEVTCAATGTGGSNSVTINYPVGTPKPSIRSGGWILDVTPVQVGTAPGTTTPINVVYGYPYRVVNATDTGANQVTLELQTPIYPAVYPAGNPSAGQAYQVTLVTVLEYAVEVFNRGSFVQP